MDTKGREELTGKFAYIYNSYNFDLTPSTIHLYNMQACRHARVISHVRYVCMRGVPARRYDEPNAYSMGLDVFCLLARGLVKERLDTKVIPTNTVV